MSVLTGKLPDLSKAKLKLLMYGDTGTGKTYLCTQFPMPYIFDTENATDKEQYRDNLQRSGGVVVYTKDFDEIYKQIRGLATEKHPYKTLVIDSLTWVYSSILRAAELMPGGTAHGRHYGEADKKMKMLIDLILRLDMHVVITTHVKEVRDIQGGLAGTTYDSYKKLGYLFDLVLETKAPRYAVVVKSRYMSFAQLDKINFVYEEIATRAKLNEIIEHKSLDLIDAATQEKLIHLICVTGTSEETVNKWLSKANVGSLDQLPESIALKLVGHLEKKDA